jgi:hypothetical protein
MEILLAVTVVGATLAITAAIMETVALESYRLASVMRRPSIIVAAMLTTFRRIGPCPSGILTGHKIARASAIETILAVTVMEVSGE